MLFLRTFTLLLLCASLFAQSSTGTLTRIVTDQSTANLPGVTFDLLNESTGAVEKAISIASGDFTFPFLPPGRYRLTAQLAGFRTYSRTDLVLESGRVTRIDIGMELGQITEKVELNSSAPLLESESSTVGQFIEHQTVVDMPLTGRRMGELLALQGNSVEF